MDKAKLFEIADSMKESIGANNLLEALIKSLSSDVLEDHLRYIDRNYETNAFND